MPVVSPFIVDPDRRFILDEARFISDLGYVPPAEEHIEENDIEQILRALFSRVS